MDFTAIESFAEVREAIALWEKKFSLDAEQFDAMGGKVFWHANAGIWGYFSKWQPKKRDGHYWNPFGREPFSFRRNMIVEINPPKSGINKNVQGVVALAADGSKWILHKGRLHPSGVRISEEMFDKVVKRRRSLVNFSNGASIGYHPVVNLSLPPKELQNEVCRYVLECEQVRKFYLYGASVAAEEKRVLDAERESSPEKRGYYIRKAQAQTKVVRRHADIWHALKNALDGESIEHSNGRVGRYGPDLRTTKVPRILFEIKSDDSAGDFQKGLGQLLLYEKLLGKKHIKVLVVPNTPRAKIEGAIKRLGVVCLTFFRERGKIKFDKKVSSKFGF